MRQEILCSGVVHPLYLFINLFMFAGYLVIHLQSFLETWVKWSINKDDVQTLHFNIVRQRSWSVLEVKGQRVIFLVLYLRL